MTYNAEAYKVGGDSWAYNESRITVKKINDEWAAAWFTHGKLNEACTYFAGDDSHDAKEDAISTAQKMIVDEVARQRATFPHV
jgi:hypothetical protein